MTKTAAVAYVVSLLGILSELTGVSAATNADVTGFWNVVVNFVTLLSVALAYFEHKKAVAVPTVSQ